MPELPNEIIFSNILTRLPAKAVGRCRSVCSEWCFSLLEEAFLRNHCSISATPSNQKVLVITDRRCTSYPIDFETNECGPGTRITIPFNHRSYDNTSIDVSIISHLCGLLFVRHRHTNDLYLWNPVTTAFKQFLPPLSNRVFNHMLDSVGLYMDAYGDFNVLYISRRDPTVDVSVWCRRNETWRNIVGLELPPECLTTRFHISTGTQCGLFVYFFVHDVFLGGTSFIIYFDITSERFGLVNLPEELPKDSMMFVHLLNVTGQLVMFTATGFRELQMQMWFLQHNGWICVESFPLISLDTYCSLSHYVTNGRRWFAMAKFRKIFEWEERFPTLDRLYPVTNWTTSNGALFTESLLAPSVEEF